MAFARHFRIVFGQTRYVILWGDLAYKFPRIKLLSWVLTVIELLRRDDPLAMRTQPGCRITKMQAVRALFCLIFFDGFLANHRENRRWRQTHSSQLAPILFALPFGLCNVQRRCQQSQPLKNNLITNGNPAGEQQEPYDARNSNFGILDGNSVWVDYDAERNPVAN